MVVRRVGAEESWERLVSEADDGYAGADGLARGTDKGSSRGRGSQVLDDVEQKSRESEIKRIGVALHDLCQPLTTLQCRLEMAELVGTPEAYREAVETGCTRFVWQVLDWNEPAIRFYESLGAKVLREWQTVRLDGEALAALAVGTARQG